MHLHPDLRALRSNDAPQRTAQAAMGAALDRWRNSEVSVRISRDLADFAYGSALADLPFLARLFEPGTPDAASFVNEVMARFGAVLGAEPLGHLPLRHFTDGTVSTLLLQRSGDATLAVVAIDGTALARRPAATSIGFAPSEAWDHVLAGSARADLVGAGDGQPGKPLGFEPLDLAPGSVVTRDGSRQTLVLRQITGTYVALRLQLRRAGEATRELRLTDGALLHQAAGTSRDSRLELAAALLGRMGRTDAAPLLAAMAQEHGSPSLRWQALRETLGLDTREGFLALSAIARSPGDALALPAGALRAQLIEQHPQLGTLEPCLS